MARLKLATIWLAGCSGCHMSFLDLDEWLLELAALADIVYSPLIDVKEFPDGVDVTLVEGAVSNDENLKFIQLVRARTRRLVSFGDCAVTGNVTALRNPIGGANAVLERSYGDRVPSEVVPRLLDRAVPVHQVVPVDAYLPGCPPSAAEIRALLEMVLRGEQPVLAGESIRFG
jgi:NAD-reducing hydrogenase small subunit